MHKVVNRLFDYKNLVFDFHTHIGLDTSLAAESEREHLAIDVKTMLRVMARSGVDRAVTFYQPIPAGQHRRLNDELFDEIEREDERRRLIPFAFINPYDEGARGLLEHLVRRGAKGVKMHPLFDNFPQADVVDEQTGQQVKSYVILDEKTAKIFEAIQDYGIPVAIHSGWGSRVPQILEVAKEFPQLKLVILHLTENVFPARPYGNVSVETSYASHPRRIRQAAEQLGADRVLFGSDHPWSEMFVEVIKVLQTPLPDEDIDKILYKNAAKLLKLEQ